MSKIIIPYELEQSVKVKAGTVTLVGDLVIPNGASGLVLFARGSGGRRHSPQNRYAAKVLQENGLATLLIDLLTHLEEEIDQETERFRFDIRLLAQRLIDITAWLAQNPLTARLRVGYFGAGTGGGAALVAAALHPEIVRAVVSQGEGPELAGAINLRRVKAPTLLIVGGADSIVIELNKAAMVQLKGVKRLEIVDGATHLFEEPGALEKVAKLASAWFIRYLK
jgi:dienelactone hydrolase